MVVFVCDDSAEIAFDPPCSHLICPWCFSLLFGRCVQLSTKAQEWLLANIRPDIILSAHTHIYKEHLHTLPDLPDVLEVTVPTVSYRMGTRKIGTRVRFPPRVPCPWSCCNEVSLFIDSVWESVCRGLLFSCKRLCARLCVLPQLAPAARRTRRMDVCGGLGVPIIPPRSQQSMRDFCSFSLTHCARSWLSVNTLPFHALSKRGFSFPSHSALAPTPPLANTGFVTLAVSADRKVSVKVNTLPPRYPQLALYAAGLVLAVLVMNAPALGRKVGPARIARWQQLGRLDSVF